MELETAAHHISAQDRRCFRHELDGNIRLLLELLDAIRTESAQIGDDRLAKFFAGLHSIVAAFASRRIPVEPARPVVVDWPEADQGTSETTG